MIYIYICFVFFFLFFSLADIYPHGIQIPESLGYCCFILVLAKEEECNVCKLFSFLRTFLRQLFFTSQLSHCKELQEVRTQNQTEVSTKSQKLEVHLLKLFLSMMTATSILHRSALINTQIQA